MSATGTCARVVYAHPLLLQIQEGQGISVMSTDSSSQLTITEGQQEHCGCYTIELKNSCGVRQAALNLTIVGKSGR